MLSYILIGLLFVLVGVAGLQFSYLFYIDRLYSERRRHMAELEKKIAKLNRRLKIAEDRVDEQQALLDTLNLPPNDNDETWAEVIDDR